MYLNISHIPVFVGPDGPLIDRSVLKPLTYLRSTLEPHFGEFCVLAPRMSIDRRPEGLPLIPIADLEGIRFETSIDLGRRARRYWLEDRKSWLADVRRLAASAAVVHSSADDPFRPICFDGHFEAVRIGRPSVFLGPDIDPYERWKNRPLANKTLSLLQFNRLMRKAMRGASLTLLKDGVVFDRYAKFGRNVRTYLDVVHTTNDVIEASTLEQRLATLSESRPLRFVFFGRLEPYKGVIEAARAVAQASPLSIEFHIYGDGSQRSEIQELLSSLPANGRVQLHDFLPHNKEFFSVMGSYDALLFTPNREDTPRMYFDALACGLPVIGTPIPFLSRRIKADGSGFLAASHDLSDVQVVMKRACEDRLAIAHASRQARAVALRDSVDSIFRRRAEQTIEAVSLHTRSLDDGS